MPVTPPLDFNAWLSTNGHLLKPPVNNFVLQQGDFLVQVVGGPNKRTDYHVNMTEEWFYQVKGNLLLKIVDTTDGGNNEHKDLWINEGSMFLLPPNVPHSPNRFENTIGIVIERKRREGEIDILRWYCAKEECREIVYEEKFFCTDLGKDLAPIIQRYANDDKLRTCAKCGTVNPTR
ncbi:3-hydroxyanthranilate 3,4-dioxygenase [Ramicandelaber brevisporus]|nr:3-hydroxyanthranilate 3,4-dioxygenase [Ramicandelaber brevisporus]